MRGDRHIFAAGLLLSIAAHAAAFAVFRASPTGVDARATKAVPLALIAVPAPVEALPLEVVRTVPPAPRVIIPEEAPEPVVAAVPAAELTLAPAPVAPPVPALAAVAQPAPATPPPPEPTARRLAQGRYEQTVTQWVERQRTYPLAARRRGWEGTAIVRLRLSADGSLLTAQLVRDTGFSLLDEAALGMVRRAAPFPHLPEEIGEVPLEVLVPIHFSLGR